MNWGGDEIRRDGLRYFLHESVRLRSHLAGVDRRQWRARRLPRFSPNVVAVGGTTLYFLGERLRFGGRLERQRRRHQPIRNRAQLPAGLAIHNGSGTIGANGKRPIPDVSLDADPSTGVAVYDSYDFGAAHLPGPRSAARVFPAPLRLGIGRHRG